MAKHNLPVYNKHVQINKYEDESALQKDVNKLLDELVKYSKLWYYHPTEAKDRGKQGIPDIVASGQAAEKLPNGKVVNKRVDFAVELKVGYNQPTPEQVSFMTKMLRGGCCVAVCYSLADVKDFLISIGIL